MGKNKTAQKKQKKDGSVFKVAGSKIHKQKNKAKPITTNLKKINAATRNKTLSADAAYDSMRDKLTATKGKDQSLKNQQVMKKRPQPKEPPNIEETMEELSKL